MDWSPLLHCEERESTGVESLAQLFKELKYREVLSLYERSGQAVIPRQPSLCSAPLNWKLSKLKHFLPTGVAPAPPAEVRCPALITPGQGTMSCRHRLGSFGLNTTCYFGCKAGFTLLGDSALSCRPSGQWTAFTPACRGKVKGGSEGNCAGAYWSLHLPAEIPPSRRDHLKCPLLHEIHTNPN